MTAVIVPTATPPVDTLGCRSQSRGSNHREHLHAGEVQQRDSQTMQRLV